MTNERKELSDSQVIEFVLGGAPAYFAVLVQRYGLRSLKSAYRRLHDWDSAEDVCQEALIDSFRRLSQLQDRSKYAAWLGAIVHNRCRMAQRIRRPEQFGVDLHHYEETKYSSVEESVSKREAAEIVSELCSLLSEAEAPVAKMFYVEGYHDREIANSLGISLPAVHSRLHKARKRLRRMMERTAETDRRSSLLIHSLIQHMKEKYIMDTIRVELSRELLALLDPAEDEPKLLESIGQLRAEIEESNGMKIPKIHVIDNLSLPENVYEVHIQGVKVTSGTASDTTEVISSLHKAILKNADRLHDPSQ